MITYRCILFIDRHSINAAYSFFISLALQILRHYQYWILRIFLLVSSRPLPRHRPKFILVCKDDIFIFRGRNSLIRRVGVLKQKTVRLLIYCGCGCVLMRIFEEALFMRWRFILQRNLILFLAQSLLDYLIVSILLNFTYLLRINSCILIVIICIFSFDLDLTLLVKLLILMLD